MKVTVERTFNLGNYENIRFTFEAENGIIRPDDEEIAQKLAEKCHMAYEAYNRSLREMKARIEAEAQRIANLITPDKTGSGGKKP